MGERHVRYHQQLQRPRALDVLSCEDISSSSDSSDSSNDDVRARKVHAEGPHLEPPMSYPVLGATEDSNDSNSQPFEVSNFNEASEPERPAERSTSGTRACFYGLSDNCLDHQPHHDLHDLGVPGVLKYMIDTAIYLAGFIHGNLNVLSDYRTKLMVAFAGVTLTLSLYSVQAPLIVCLCVIAIASAYAVQHNILSRATHVPLDSSLYQQTFQRFLGRYSTRSQLHNVFPCSNCQDQFAERGIFDLHNTVASRLNKAHICSAPYGGYDYLVAYLVWGMERAMVDTYGHGFLSAGCEEPRRPDDDSFLHDSTRIYAAHFLRGAESAAARNFSNCNSNGNTAGDMNRNNSNSNMDYRPASDSGDATSEDYNTPSRSSGSSDSSNSSESNTSMEYLALSQESTESEGYHTAMNQHSPTTSMNVHFVNNDDAATSTEVEDYNTFSMYTSRSSNTDSYDDDDDDEEEEDNGSETADDFTTASNYSPNASLRCTSPNGSEATQQGSEHDTTKSQCGSELTKDETVATKSEPRTSRSQARSKAAKTAKGAVGDNTMVSQVIAGSVAELLAIKTHTDSSQAGSEANGSSTKADVDCREAKSVTCSPGSESASSTKSSRSHTRLLPRSPVDNGQDPLNKNNNGNTLIKSQSETKYSVIDVEANIENRNGYCATPATDYDSDGITYVPPCVLREDSDLEITYAASTGSLDSDGPGGDEDMSSGSVSSSDQSSSDESEYEDDRFVMTPYDRGDSGDMGTTGEDLPSVTRDPESLQEPGVPPCRTNKPRRYIPLGTPSTVYPHDVHMADQEDDHGTGQQQNSNPTFRRDDRQFKEEDYVCPAKPGAALGQNPGGAAYK